MTRPVLKLHSIRRNRTQEEPVRQAPAPVPRAPERELLQGVPQGVHLLLQEPGFPEPPQRPPPVMLAIFFFGVPAVVVRRFRHVQ